MKTHIEQTDYIPTEAEVLAMPEDAYMSPPQLAFFRQLLESMRTELLAKGGFYAVVPVVTVFLFSYIHGSFAGSFWSALGIEASKGAAAKKQAGKTAEKRKDDRATARVNA